jgi:hypothetical protein
LKLNKLDSCEIFKISFIVCSNGFGHFKRALETSYSILKINKNVHITIFCSIKHLQLVYENINFKSPLNQNICFNTKLYKYEVDFLNFKNGSYDKYLKWNKVLSTNKILIDSNLIISDNQIAPLNTFKNVILMGSFIWHNLVELKDKDYKRIIGLEKKLLLKNKPIIICLQNMAMDNLYKYTNPVFVPWFTSKNKYQLVKKQKKSILLTGGGTKFQDYNLIKISKYVLQLDEDIIIYQDNKLFKKMNILNDRLKIFSFTENDFLKLNAIVCRPGIGILTDCIKYNIPPIAIDDNTNLEISNNAFKLEKQKIGISIKIEKNDNVSLVCNQILNFLNNKKKIDRIRNRIKMQKCNGSDYAANFIIKKYIKNESN